MQLTYYFSDKRKIRQNCVSAARIEDNFSVNQHEIETNRFKAKNAMSLDESYFRDTIFPESILSKIIGNLDKPNQVSDQVRKAASSK